VGRSERKGFLGPALLAAVLMTSALVPSARAAFPPLPLADDGRFVSGLTAPVLAPGSSGTVSLELSDPLGAADLLDTSLSIGIYAFNAYPGNATQSVPAGAISLSASGRSGSNLTLSLGTVVPGAPVAVQIAVASASSAPSGTYALRFQLEFMANGTSYLLDSRGEFTDAEWAAATAGPNGTSTLNLTTLGVSGIVPETGVLVQANPFPTALAVILAASLILAAAGGYYAFRRAPRSRSGAATPDDPSQAPTALGKRRKSDGD